MTHADLYERNYDAGCAKYGLAFRRACLATEKVMKQYNVQNVPIHALIVDTIHATFEAAEEVVQTDQS